MDVKRNISFRTGIDSVDANRMTFYNANDLIQIDIQ